MTPSEKIIIRNQRLIMLALLNLLRNQRGPLTEYNADKLRDRVVQLEQNYDWIAAPSERL
jgi:hypothetical protein